MKKLLILILLFVVACSSQNEKLEVKSNAVIVSEKNQKEDIKTIKYNEKGNEDEINKENVGIISKKEIVETKKDAQPEVAIKNKVELKVNNTYINKEVPKEEDKQETSPPVALPNEDAAPIPKSMPENRLEVKSDPPVEEVYTEEIYIGEVGNSGKEFNNWDEAGNFAEAEVHDKNSKYYHYSWARTTIISYKFDSKGNAVPNSKRETYTIDFWE